MTRSERRLAELEHLDRLNRRDQAMTRKWNDIRLWMLTCPGCEHVGTVETTLRRLRASNLICSACGTYIWHKPESRKLAP